MDLNKLIGTGNPAAMNVLPEEVQTFIARVLEGRIRSFVIVAEESDGYIADQIALDMNNERSNVYSLIGAIECAKRDLMRIAVESRVTYEEAEDNNND